jgi:hypothetical protein
MKRIILLSVLTLGLAINSIAQSLERVVISSGNGSATSAINESVEFTIGQPFFTGTLTNNTGTYLTQGFVQPTNTNNEINNPSNFLEPEIEFNALKTFPNPAVDFTNIELSLIDNDGAKISIIDMWGQPLNIQEYTASQGKNVFKFVFGNVPAGIYTISVYANKKLYNKKLLVAGTRATINI